MMGAISPEQQQDLTHRHTETEEYREEYRAAVVVKLFIVESLFFD